MVKLYLTVIADLAIVAMRLSPECGDQKQYIELYIDIHNIPRSPYGRVVENVVTSLM